MKTSLVVIKVGSSTLTDSNRNIKLSFVEKLCEEIATLKKNGWNVVLVTSGAMASGTGVLKKIPHNIVERSLFACIGQPYLMNVYADFFKPFDVLVAQCLLTGRNFKNEIERNLMKTNMEKMLENGILPIVNENDLIAIEELSVGDNDRLAAHLSVLLSAQKLILVTDVDGIYTADPIQNPDAKRLETLKEITDETFEYVQEKSSTCSLGGMGSKLISAKYASENGVETAIISGMIHQNPLIDILMHKKMLGTTVLAKKI